MVRTAIKVLLVDVVLLVGMYYVIKDIAWRSSCTMAFPQCRYSVASFQYSPLTYVTTLSSGGIPLVSPLTVDWIQLFTAVLIVLNLWFVYSYLRSRRAKGTPAVPRIEADSSQPS